MASRLNLPETLVLSHECYATCLAGFSSELWDDQEFERLAMAAYEQRCDPLRLEVLEHAWQQLRWLRRYRWWKRRKLVHDQWSPATKVYVAKLLLGDDVGASPPQWLDVPVRGWRWLEPGELLPMPGPRKSSDDICTSLISTMAYCRWLAAGGDADLGRYIATYYEAERME